MDLLKSVDWVKDVIAPTGTLALGGLIATLLTLWIQSIGAVRKKHASLPERVEKLEANVGEITADIKREQERTDQGIRVLLSVTNHGNAAVRALVEANKKQLNGSYERTIRHLDDADEEQRAFLEESYGATR